MRIEEVHIGELRAFVASDAFRLMEVLPVSAHRAISHSENPRAQAEDTALILVYDESGRLMAYLGILPDDFFVNEKAVHAGWMSCIWVHPEARGKGLAKHLVERALLSWQNRIIGTEFTPQARDIYLRSGKFDLFTRLEGIRLYYRFSLHEILPAKKPSLTVIKPLLKAADLALNVFQGIRLRFARKHLNVTVEEVDRFSEELRAFINSHNKGELSRRGPSELQWILQYPWVLQADEKDEDARRYHFTSVDVRFRYKSLAVRKDGQLIAYLLLVIRGNAMKLPYAYFIEGEEKTIAALLNQIDIDEKVSTLTVYHPALAETLRNYPSPAYYKRNIVREYVISKELNALLKDNKAIGLQAGDGDCAFT